METERTLLTTITPDDFGEILDMYSEPDTFKYIPPLQNKSREEYIDFLNSRIAQVTGRVGYHWVVRLKDTGSFIGLLNLNPIKDTEKMQIGFQLRQRYWNQGYAREVTKRLVEFAVSELGLKVLYGVFNKRNTASKKIFERFGFEFEENRTVDHDETAIEIWKRIITKSEIVT